MPQPGALEAVILRALNKEPGDRYATATEMVEALESVSPREAPEAGLLAPSTAVEPAVDESPVEARPERRLSVRLTLLLVFVGIAVLQSLPFTRRLSILQQFSMWSIPRFNTGLERSYEQPAFANNTISAASIFNVL